MNKVLTGAMAAVTLGGAIAASATPALARDHGGGGYGGGYYSRSYGGGGGGGYYGGRYYGHNGYNNNGAALAAGVVGLALGAALASNSHSYAYDRPYYRSGYYDYDYPTYRTCVTTRWVWDPYIGRRVPVREHYAC